MDLIQSPSSNPTETASFAKQRDISFTINLQSHAKKYKIQICAMLLLHGSNHAMVECFWRRRNSKVEFIFQFSSN